MNLTTKIAWRNIWRHKHKSIIIGVILFLGTFLMTLGNAVVAGMEKGLEENLKGTFTGDLLVIPSKEDSDAVFADISGSARELIPNYFEVEKAVRAHKDIEKTMGMAFGLNYILNEDSDIVPVGIIGVNIKDFLEFYEKDRRVIVEGQMLQENERGVLVGNLGRKNIIRMGDFWIKPKNAPFNKDFLTEEAKAYGDNLTVKDELVIMGTGKSNSSFDIKVPVIGIYKLKSLDKLMGDDFIMDIDSFREANGMITGNDKSVELSKEDKKNLDDGFDFDEGFIEENQQNSDVDNSESVLKIESNSENKIVADSGAYNIIVVKTNKNVNQEELIKELNKEFKEKKLEVRAVTWSASLGFMGKIALFIKIALNIFVLFIFFVAIIVIMNTLSMTAMERVTEIGMMRAVGAQKKFLRIMFVKETGYLAFFFGGIGIGVGILLVMLLQVVKIETSNEFLQLAYGGDYLNPIITFTDLVIGVIELCFVTIVSLIYPLKLVSKIKPLDAISRD